MTTVTNNGAWSVQSNNQYASNFHYNIKNLLHGCQS